MVEWYPPLGIDPDGKNVSITVAEHRHGTAVPGFPICVPDVVPEIKPYTTQVKMLVLPDGRVKLLPVEDAASKSDAPQTPVDVVIDALGKPGVIGAPDRTRLRGALDKADKPLDGRAGADEALGRVTRYRSS
jgi:hypothetical protein